MKSTVLAIAASMIGFIGVLACGGAESAPSGQKLESADQQIYEPAPDGDLKAVQGVWARTETVGLFGKRRITKEISGDHETVTYYDAIGGVEKAHTVKVDLRRAGPIRVFTYSQQKFTAGPNQGTEVQGTGAYVYKVVGDTFIEIWGIVGDENREIEIMRWQRVKP